MISDTAKQNIRFILDLIDNGEIKYYIDTNIDLWMGTIQTPYGFISLDMVEDIQSHQEHYRKFI